MTELLVSAIINGLQQGIILFLIASGLSITFGLLGVINFAHGALYMIGAYVGLMVIGSLGSFFLSLIVAVIVVALIGVIMEYYLIRPIYDRVVDQILLTFGVAVVIEQAVILQWGARSVSFPTPEYFTRSIGFAGMSTSSYTVFVLGFGTAIMVGMYLFLMRTRYGYIVQAGVEDTEMVESVGINVRLLFTAVFAFGAALAALAAVIAAPRFSVNPHMGVDVIIEAFIVVVIGGLGQFQGIIAAAMLIGMIQGIGGMYVPAYTEIIQFALIIAVLLIRPEGLFGSVHHQEH